MTDLEKYQSLPAEERDKLGFAKWQEQTRIGTHAEGCFGWGPRHYECAVEEIARLKREQFKNPETLPEITNYLRDLSHRMLVCGTAMDYYGGFNQNMPARGLEMVGAARIAKDWAEDIEDYLKKIPPG